MQRVETSPRTGWQTRVEEAGLNFHTQGTKPYWDETSAYRFSHHQIEEHVSAPSEELHQMCMEATQKVAASQELMERVGIPDAYRDFVANSLQSQDPDLMGRFDLIYDGQSTPKMIEYNADTPVTLLETCSIQWDWLQDQISTGALASGCDQRNDLFEALTERFEQIFPQTRDIHFAALGDAQTNPEDYAATETMAWAAHDAGHRVHFTQLDQIGIAETGQFVDDEDQIIGSLFKLYPWEDMLQDDFAVHLSTAQCRYFEPPWKAITSSKGLLPILWEMFEGHPNLLPTFFASDIDGVTRAQDLLQKGHVKKPILSRQGGSITIFESGHITEQSVERCFNNVPSIIQAYAPCPVISGFRPVLGSFVVDGKCVGLGIREDQSRITQDDCRFKPHFIQDTH